MSIVTRPHIPRASEPSRDDDPTGVHALLSSLPHPEPMPQHLIERINASLAAEQAQRAAGTENESVSPMVTRRAHRPARLVFAVAGAAAAVMLVAVVSSLSLSGSQTTATSIGAAIASSGGNADEAAPNADPRTPAGGQPDSKSQPESKSQPGSPAASGPASRGGFASGETIVGTGFSAGVPALQIRQSGTLYTQADFLAQAVSLHQAALTGVLLQSASDVGPASTTDWLRECMNAIGASEIQLAEADIAFYQGQPAVIIVGIEDGAPLAYVVAPQCSHAHPAMLRPATSLS